MQGVSSPRPPLRPLLRRAARCRPALRPIPRPSRRRLRRRPRPAGPAASSGSRTTPARAPRRPLATGSRGAPAAGGFPGGVPATTRGRYRRGNPPAGGGHRHPLRGRGGHSRRRRRQPLPPALAGDNSERRRRLPSLGRRLSPRRRRSWRRLFDYRPSYTPLAGPPIYGLDAKQRRRFFFYSKRFVPGAAKGTLAFRRYFLGASDYRAAAPPSPSPRRGRRLRRRGLRPLRRLRRRGTGAAGALRRRLRRTLVSRRRSRRRGLTAADRWQRSLAALGRQRSAAAPLDRGLLAPLAALAPATPAAGPSPEGSSAAREETLAAFFGAGTSPAAPLRRRLRWLRTEGRAGGSGRRQPLPPAAAATLLRSPLAPGVSRLLGRLSHPSRPTSRRRPIFPRRRRRATCRPRPLAPLLRRRAPTLLHPLLRSRSFAPGPAAPATPLASRWRRRQLRALGEALALRRLRRRRGDQSPVAGYSGEAMLALQRERLLEAYRNGEAAHWQESYATLAAPVKRGKRAQRRYARGSDAELYALPGDSGYGRAPAPGRRPRSQRGRRGALRRARLGEFLRRRREELLRSAEEGEEPDPLLLSTRLSPEEYLPNQRSNAPFVPRNPASDGRWKPSLRQRRRPAPWLAAPRYLPGLRERRWYPRVHRPDRGFRSVLALQPLVEVESRRSRAYAPRTFGHGRSYLARRLRWKVGYGGRLPHSIRLWMGLRQGALWGKFNSPWGMGFHNLGRKRRLLRRCRRRRRRFTVAALGRWLTLQRQQRWAQLRRRRRFFTALWLRRSVQRHVRRVSLEGATGQLRIYREAETMYRRLVAVPQRQRKRLRRQRLQLRLRRWAGLAARGGLPGKAPSPAPAAEATLPRPGLPENPLPAPFHPLFRTHRPPPPPSLSHPFSGPAACLIPQPHTPTQPSGP